MVEGRADTRLDVDGKADADVDVAVEEWCGGGG